jgi:hypothetical protein
VPLTPDDYRAPLARAEQHAREWLESLPERPVRPSQGIEQLEAAFAGALPEHPSDPAAVIDELARLAEPGLMAIGSGRFLVILTMIEKARETNYACVCLTHTLV